MFTICVSCFTKCKLNKFILFSRYLLFLFFSLLNLSLLFLLILYMNLYKKTKQKQNKRKNWTHRRRKHRKAYELWKIYIDYIEQHILKFVYKNERVFVKHSHVIIENLFISALFRVYFLFSIQDSVGRLFIHFECINRIVF